MAILTKGSNRRTFWVLLGLLVLIAGVTGGWWIWSQSSRASTQVELRSQTAPVVREDITVRVSAAGIVRPLTPVNISPKQSGRLAALYVEQGDRVKAGQILARMDASNLQGELLSARGNLAATVANLQRLQGGNRPQEISQAEQNLRQAQADLIATRSTYESNVRLYTSGAVSRNALDVSRSQYESAQARIGSLQQALALSRAGFRKEEIDAAQAQVLQARGNLETIAVQIADTVIRAPFAGIVTQKYANSGAFVTPTTTASTTTSATSSSLLALANSLEAVANVAESDIRNIYPGQSATLRVDAYPGRLFQGKVRLVAPEAVVTQNVTSFEVRVRILDDARHQLKSGMNLSADFLVGEHKNALLVPTTAIVSEAEGTAVYLSGAQRPRLRKVRVGATVGARTEILAGLSAGERVFITFPGQRKPNDRPVRNNGSPLAGGGRPSSRTPR